MAQFPAVLAGKHRDEFVVFRFQQRIRVDIHDNHLENKLAAQDFKRGEHVIAKMTVGTTVKG